MRRPSLSLHSTSSGRLGRARRRRGFTLVEALVAVSIAVIAASALSLGITSSLQNVDASLEQAVAQGIAQQLMDEILGAKYAEPANTYAADLGPSAYDLAGRGRERFTESGDFNGFVTDPPQSPLGVALGSDDGAGTKRHPAFCAPADSLSGWRQQVEVYYVSNTDQSQRLSPGVTSNYRAVEVSVLKNDGERGWREIILLRRVLSNVPTS